MPDFIAHPHGLTATAENQVAPPRHVTWPVDLLEADPVAAASAFARSVHGFAKRLEPAERAVFVAALDSMLYSHQGESAAAASQGLHPKHRLMRYHDFFTSRIAPGERVIDLGSGNGALSVSMARAGASVTGMDFEPQNIAKSQSHARELNANARFVLGDITKDRADGAFDVIVLSNVLEHIDRRIERLQTWRAWYAPKRFLIRVPAFDRDWRVPWKRELGVEWRLDVTHEVEYTRQELETELADAGLTIREWTVNWGEYWVVAQ